MFSLHIPPALTHRRFRLLWAGLFISVAGSRMQFLGIGSSLVAQFFGAPIAVITGGIGCILATGWTARKWPQLLHYEGEKDNAN